MQAATNCLFISFYWARITKVFVLLPGPNKKKERQFVISLSRNGGTASQSTLDGSITSLAGRLIPGLRNWPWQALRANSRMSRTHQCSCVLGLMRAIRELSVKVFTVSFISFFLLSTRMSLLYVCAWWTKKKEMRRWTLSHIYDWPATSRRVAYWPIMCEREGHEVVTPLNRRGGWLHIHMGA